MKKIIGLLKVLSFGDNRKPKTTGGILLLFTVFLSMSLPIKASASWTVETVDAPRYFQQYAAQRSLAIDNATGYPHMAYGGDRLYHSYFDGTQWHYEVVDNSPAGQVASIVIDSNGKAHISYQNGANYDLKYATNASGSWVTETVDSAGSVGAYSSIALDSNNKIHISYLDWTNHYLKYATNTSGTWTVASLNSMGQYGFYTSLAVDSYNKVHISCQFKASGAYALLYVTNVSGTWVTSAVDSSVLQDVGEYISIAVDSNNSAHISYKSGSDSGDYAVKYATNASGSWVRYMIDSYGVPFGMTSIAVDSPGKVHFSYVDADGELRYATDASGTWSTMTLDGTVGDVWSTSMAIDSSNKIHVIYYDNESHDISYATKTSGPWTSSITDISGKIGDNTSIALDSNDKVHIGYYDTAYNLLKYAENVPGTWTTSTIDIGVKYFTAVAVDSQNSAHMAYFSYQDYDLKYATNSPGVWVTSTIDSAGTVGQYTSVALDSGDKVHISYFDFTNGDLKYATNELGLWIASTVDPTGYTGEYTSLALDANGKVHISYYDLSNGDLKYATNVSGSWVASTIDSTGNVGMYTSLAFDADGRVHISYYDSSNGDLKYATNASGSWVTSMVDSTDDVGKGTSIAIDSHGKVHISFCDATNKALKYATNAFSICTDNDGDGYGNPGDASCPNGSATDCNDSNALEHPNQTWYKDTDNDGYSNGDIIVDCPRPAGYKAASELTATSGDCDDTDSARNPGATEVCNGIDDNCSPDGWGGWLIDEGLLNTYYQDADGDGYGNGAVSTQACTAPAGYITDNTDCDDTNSARNPGATEVCNGVDDNCSPDGWGGWLIDEGFDADSDSIADCFDNCVNVPNPVQRDTNSDEDDNTNKAGIQHYGNLCDPDFNNNGLVGLEDFNTWRTYYRQAVPPAPDDVDLNGNGIIDLGDHNIWRQYYRRAPGPGVGD